MPDQLPRCPVADCFRSPMSIGYCEEHARPLAGATMRRLVRAVFADTFTGRMLRAMILRGTWTQAEFMADYMRRCARKPTGPSRYTPDKNPDKVNPSSFGNNFGRYATHARAPVASTWHTTFVGWALGVASTRLVVLRQTRVNESANSGRNRLEWCGPTFGALFSEMSDDDLEWAFQSMERQHLGPRPTDADGEHATWMAFCRDEIERRGERLSRVMDAHLREAS